MKTGSLPYRLITICITPSDYKASGIAAFYRITNFGDRCHSQGNQAEISSNRGNDISCSIAGNLYCRTMVPFQLAYHGRFALFSYGIIGKKMVLK
jgi:hypothetical protein